jgi:hypothetical protein
MKFTRAQITAAQRKLQKFYGLPQVLSEVEVIEEIEMLLRSDYIFDIQKAALAGVLQTGQDRINLGELQVVFDRETLKE